MLSIYAVLALSAARGALCWGELGHGTVAYIAQKYLTSASVAYINQVLVDEQGNPVDFFDASIWPDEVRRARPYSEDWHFIGTLPYSCSSSVSYVAWQMLKINHRNPVKYHTRRTAPTARTKMAVS